MKKTLLFLFAMLAIVGATFAQSVYTTGYYVNTDNVKTAVVYGDNQKLFEVNMGVNDVSSSSIAVDPNTGDVYYVRNSTEYGDIYLNNTKFLDNNSGTHINTLLFDELAATLYSGGYVNGSSIPTAVIWKDGNKTPLFTLGDGVGESEVLSVFIVDDMVLSCGYEYVSNELVGCVWLDGGLLISRPGVMITDIAYYDGTLYQVGFLNENSYVWVGDDTEPLYELTPTESSYGYDLKIESGDIYVTGYHGAEDVCVWKNGEILYNHNLGNSGYFYSAVVNADGVYYVGCNSQQQGVVYKNGELLYSFENCCLSDIYVKEPECSNENVCQLPYFEGFEMGETDWSCWMVTDEGENSDYMLSYWHRSGTAVAVSPATGMYCAGYDYNASAAQEGWLVSPLINLPEYEVKMSFKTFEKYPSYCEYEGVWVSTTGTDPADFTEVWNGTAQASEEWKECEIDLSSFGGQQVYVAFKYTGFDGHNWYIDDINIEAVLPEFTINAETNNPLYGSVTGGGVFKLGESCTLTATALDGFQLLNWTKDGIEVSTSTEYTFVVTEDATYMANFIQAHIDTYQLTLTCNPSQGYVEGTGTYVSGTVVTVKANPYDGFVFMHWNDGNTDNPRTLTVTSNLTLVAFFSGTGVDENGETLLNVYPNPANDMVRIEGLESLTEVRIYNSIGVMVKSLTTDKEINVSDLSAGLYLIQCGDQTLRFVKK